MQGTTRRLTSEGGGDLCASSEGAEGAEGLLQSQVKNCTTELQKFYVLLLEDPSIMNRRVGVIHKKW